MLSIVLLLSLLSCTTAKYQYADDYNDISTDAPNSVIYGKLNLLITSEKVLCFKLDSFIEKMNQQFSNQSNYYYDVSKNLNRSMTKMFTEFQNSTLHTIEQTLKQLNKTTNNEKPCQSNDSSHPQKYPSSCAEAVDQNGGKSGLYKIQVPDSAIRPFFIYCELDPNGGPAWNVIQRRTDGSLDFYLNWTDYKYGFGNLENEYFIGLEKLHELTTSKLHELWIKMEDFENTVKHARYDKFAIGDENQGYALNVLGSFSGDAGDSLIIHAGQKFSTRDVKNDNNPNENCAQAYRGAWWYHNCHHSNLNGLYLQGEYGNSQYAQGINWYWWKGHFYSLKYAHMAIRPLSVK